MNATVRPSVCHLTSAHPRTDIRIFIKECQTLAQAGFRVALIVADELGNDTVNEIQVYDVGRNAGRWARMTQTTRRVFDVAKQVNADIYHAHDPELLPTLLRLKALGKKVIFDAHEDLPNQVRSKPYLNKLSRKLLPPILRRFENYAGRRLDAIVAATPYIRDKFLEINSLTVDVNNYPLLEELFSSANTRKDKLFPPSICYVGSISEIRGIRTMIDTLDKLDGTVRLSLAGRFSEPQVEREVTRQPGWQHVDSLGLIDRADVRTLVAQSVAGIVTFLDAPNHTHSQPNKMFEYMSAGLPVIASNFPLWRDIIEGNECGICVDPTDSSEIAAAITQIIRDPEKAAVMGKNGRRAIEQRYNWENEKTKLLSLYNQLP